MVRKKGGRGEKRRGKGKKIGVKGKKSHIFRFSSIREGRGVAWDENEVLKLRGGGRIFQRWWGGGYENFEKYIHM